MGVLCLHTDKSATLAPAERMENVMDAD